ncbi:MAG TPA: hypothetical protein VJN65_08965 [Bacteroidota bacterium]|nr:hypothetical protein [Bacteroidota bacterium]
MKINRSISGILTSFSLCLLTGLVIGLLPSNAAGQVKVISMEKLTLGSGRSWAYGQFSPDGKRVYFSTLSYDGIWSYDIDTRRLVTITEDKGSGYEFVLSADEKTITYRRTITQFPAKRLQQIVEKNLDTGIEEIRMSGMSVSAPRLASRFAARQGGALQKGVSIPVAVGIDKTKITVEREGHATVLDPFEGGRYIWPSLAPSADKLAAYEMGKGLFVCSLDGTEVSQLGKYTAPSWTFDGAWIVATKERDDGHQLLSSDLFCLSPESRVVVQLTATPDVFELFPSCSPSGRMIVFHTPNGELYLLTYEEERP